MALGSGGGGASSGAVRAGGAFVELFVKNSLTRGLNDAAKTFKSFGNSIGSIGKTMALGGAAAFTPLIGAMSTLNDIAKQGSIAKAFGLTSEQFTGMAGVAKSAGGDVKEFMESMVTLGQIVQNGLEGKGDIAKNFIDKLGVSAEEFRGMRLDQQFYKVLDILNQMEGGADRVNLFGNALGTDGAKLLIPLLGKSKEEIQEIAKATQISTDDMKAATSAAASYATATTALSKAWQSVSIAAAPIVKILAEGIAQAVTPFREFVNANREAVVGLSLAAGGVTAVGLGLMVLGPAIKALAGSWALFTGAVAVGKATLAGTMAVIAAPILLIPAGLAAAGAYFLATSEKIQSGFMSIFGRVKEGWSAVVGAVAEGDLELAFQIVSANIEAEWLRLTTFATDTWKSFTDAFTLEGFVEIFKNAFGVIRDLFLDMMDDIREGDYTGALRGGPGEARELRSGMFGGGGAATLGDWGDDTPQEKADARAKWFNSVGKFRQAFRNMGKDWDGGGGDWGDNPLAGQIAGIAAQSRGGFGGNVSSGMFGGGDGVKQIVKAVNDVEKAIKIAGVGGQKMPDGLVFAEGE